MQSRFLATVGAAMLAGSAALPAAAQTAAPPPPTLEFVFEETVLLGGQLPVGETINGVRNAVLISGGTFEGPGIRGTIMPGGWDWQLRHANGCLSIKADYMLKTDDGVVINIVNQGLSCPAGKDPPKAIFTSPAFEAPLGKYDWLNRSIFVGTLEAAPGKPGVHARFYRVR